VSKKREKIRFIFIACIFLGFLISGCAQKNAETKEEESLASVMGDKSGDSVNVALPGDAVLNLSGDDDSADLPEDYPADVLPLHKGCFIESVLGADGGYTIVAYSKDNLEDIILFYKNALKEAEVIAETDWDDGFTSFGTLGEYTYNIGVNASEEKKGYTALITINLFPAQ